VIDLHADRVVRPSTNAQKIAARDQEAILFGCILTGQRGMNRSKYFGWE
jgi:hypothetical protein